MLSGGGEAATAEHEAAMREAHETIMALHRGFLATPYRPTGLSTSARAIVRLVDELQWLDAIIMTSRPLADGAELSRASCAVRSAAASVLEHAADRVDSPAASPDGLRLAMSGLREALDRLEQTATAELPVRRVPATAAPGATASQGQLAGEEQITEFVTSLDSSFRAQELSYAVSQIAHNIHLAVAAEQRGWLERMLGREPSNGLAGVLPAATERFMELVSSVDRQYLRLPGLFHEILNEPDRATWIDKFATAMLGFRPSPSESTMDGRP